MVVALGLLPGSVIHGSSQVVGWGFDASGEATGTAASPTNQMASGVVRLAGEGLTNIVGIAAGYEQSLALSKDGTVIGWGRNDCGQATGRKGGQNGIVTINGVVLSNVIAISSGFLHSLALLNNGTVAAWGNQATVPEGLSNVVAISAGWDHSLALKKDGTVVSWPIQLREGMSNIVAIGASSIMNGEDVVAKADGTLIMCNNGPGGSRSIKGISNVVAVAVGSHVLALTREGTVFEIDCPPVENRRSDVAWLHEGLTNVVAIAAGRSRCLALRGDGTVVVVFGEGFPSFLNPPGDLKNVIGIAAGGMFCLALEKEGP